MTIWNTPINSNSEEYLLSHSQFDNSVLDFVFDSANSFEEPQMQISKLQATNLQGLVRQHSVQRILEVGSFVGFSAFCMALAVERRPKTWIRTIEIRKDFIKQAEANKSEILQKKKHSSSILEQSTKLNLLKVTQKKQLMTLFLAQICFFWTGIKSSILFILIGLAAV